MNQFTKSISVFFFTVLLMTAGVIFMVTAPCSGQVARESWQPPEKIMDAIGVRPGMRIGEAGAGRGYFAFPLARRVGNEGIVYANDISAPSLEFIRNRASNEGLENIKIVMGEVEDPLFPEKNLDMIVMVYVLHMLERPIPFLKNLHSYIRPGGLLVIIERNTTVERAHAPSFMTNRQILATLNKTGFELDRTETFLPRDTIYIYKTKSSGNIHEAAAAGDQDKVRALLEADSTLLESKDKDKNTPLIIACLNRQVAVANFLIDKGANVKARGRFNFTTLEWASRVHDQDTALIQRLIDKGSDIHARSDLPLHFAALEGSFQVAKLLIDNGANVNAVAENGNTPLTRAAQGGHLDVAKLLIEHGADVNAYDKYSGPLGTFDIAGRILDIAISFCSDEQMAKLLLESGAKLNNTELHSAAAKGDAELTKLFVEYGVDLNVVDKKGHTALYYAAKYGYKSVAEVLIAAGADESAIIETNYGKAPQLTETLQEGEAYLWNIGHGYVVKTKGNLLISTPIRINESKEAGLANGNLNPNELAEQNITVFASHPYPVGESDNWRIPDPSRFELAKRIPETNWVFDSKPTGINTNKLDFLSYYESVPYESFSFNGIQVHTIPTLVGGMGYLVEADGIKVFFAGYHVSDNKAENIKKYRKEIDFLKPFGPIDIAVISVCSHDTRIGYSDESHLYLLDQLSPKVIYLFGANNSQSYFKCAEVLGERNIPIAYPEREGDRFHFIRE